MGIARGIPQGLRSPRVGVFAMLELIASICSVYLSYTRGSESISMCLDLTKTHSSRYGHSIQGKDKVVRFPLAVAAELPTSTRSLELKANILVVLDLNPTGFRMCAP